jgi:histidinol-phosphate aminotransferase
MAAAVTSRTRLVFIANPNNPTGTIVGRRELTAFIESLPEDVLVCLDEAYCEYVTHPDFPDSLAYIAEGRPVVVLRTFSKIYGLAGLRAGYGIAHPDIVKYMNGVRQPFNVNTLAQVAALAALDDSGHVALSRENNRTGLEYLFRELSRMGLECVPTQANFFLVKVGDGSGVYEALLGKGVIVRPMQAFGLGEYIRVTVGLPEENGRFIRALSGVLGQGVQTSAK